MWLFCLAAAVCAPAQTLRKIDVDLLDDISRRSFHYFWEQASPRTGLMFDVWGITASDSAHGYTDWGSGSEHPRIDGTVVPSAAAGSLIFTPDICIPAVRTMLLKYGKDIYGRYGFADAFNPSSGWVSPYVIGIDAGITLLSAENLRAGRVWRWFMADPAPEHALDLVGLKKSSRVPTVANPAFRTFRTVGNPLNMSPDIGCYR